MVKSLYKSLCTLAIAFVIAGCNPGITDVVQPPVTDASAYFFPKNFTSVHFIDSIGSVGSPITLNVIDSGGKFSMSEMNGSNQDVLSGASGSESVSISGITIHSFIPLPDGYSIQPKKDSIVLTTPFPMNHIIAVSDKIIIASNDSGVYYTSNGGQSWASSQTSFRTSRVTAFATLGNNIYAGTEGGDLYYSMDNGKTWQPGGKTTSGRAIIALASNSYSLFISDGITIYRAPNPTNSFGVNLKPTQGLTIASLAASDSSQTKEEIIVAGTNQGIYYRHGDSDWVHATTEFRSIKKVIATPKQFYCSVANDSNTSLNGIYSSEDGITWVLRDHNFSSALLAYGSGSIIAASSSGIIDSINDGSSTSSGTSIHGLQGKTINDLSAFGSVYFAATETGVYIDAGGAWNLSASGISSTEYKYTEAAGDLTLLHTSSGGSSLDSSWSACALLKYPSKDAIPITGRIIAHYDSLSVLGKTYSDIIVAQYSYETAGILNTLYPHLQIFYAKNEGPVLIYLFGSNGVTRKIFRTQ